MGANDGMGPEWNLVGSDVQGNDFNTFVMWNNKLPVPQGNLMNPNSIIMGGSTITRLNYEANSLSFNFWVANVSSTATGINSADTMVLNADLYNANNEPAILFTITGSCKTRPGGAIC